MLDIEAVKRAIARRQSRGASDDSIREYLENLKAGAWRYAQDHIDVLLAELAAGTLTVTAPPVVTIRPLSSYEISYNYCRICGRRPHTNMDEPNWAPIRFWDPDDGWIIGTLCRWCFDECGHVQPHPDDYAYAQHYQDVATDVDTDEDPLLAL